MAKIFRFSGYFVDGDEPSYSKENFDFSLCENIKNETGVGAFQQLHIEESKKFELDGELEDNCDLALLTRHFNHNYPPVIDFDRPIPQRGERYKHFKLGKIVEIIGLSRHTENEEITVVYEYEGKIWNRPLSMFMSEVDHDKYPDATQKYRFEKVKES